MTRRADLAPHALHCRCARCGRLRRAPGTRWGIALSVLSAVVTILLIGWALHASLGR